MEDFCKTTEYFAQCGTCARLSQGSGPRKKKKKRVQLKMHRGNAADEHLSLICERLSLFVLLTAASNTQHQHHGREEINS